jgi:hypothetical protein
MAGHYNNLYVISGISGSGKTTLGAELLKEFRQCAHIDQDSFYLKTKPKVKLSNGLIVSNWDCLEALDPIFKDYLRDVLKVTPVILTGFALCRQVLPVVPKVHIHLVTGNTPEDVEGRCIKARAQAKSVNSDRDLLVVKELVLPFYYHIVENSDITHCINVFDDKGNRVPIKWITNISKKIIGDNM